MAVSNFLSSEFAAQFQDRVSSLVVMAGDCWEYTGTHYNKSGYGRLTHNYKNYATHRLVYAMVFGDIPVNEYVLHRCDNPPCCNPAHLFLGSHADNVADVISKGRRVNHRNVNPARGERTAHAKLTEQKVRDIRNRYASGERAYALAAEFLVGLDTISVIVNRHSWKHVN